MCHDRSRVSAQPYPVACRLAIPYPASAAATQAKDCQMDNSGSTIATGNLKSNVPAQPISEEIFDTLIERSGVKVERIVSTGQVTAQGAWYDQQKDEWVVVIAGSARLRIEGEKEDRALSEGDWIYLPAHCRHRVTWTQAEPPTIWLALHF